MSYREQYDFWLQDGYFDEKTKEELRSIAGDALSQSLNRPSTRTLLAWGAQTRNT